MKKNINVFFASIIALSLGFAQAQAKEEKLEAPVKIKEVAKGKTTPAPAVQTVVKPMAKPACKVCNKEEKPKTISNCTKKVNTIVYKGSCNENCGFPVTVRVPTNCKGSM